MSDTHLPRFGRVLPRALIDGFEGAAIDRIVHAGDWTDPLALTLLETVAPVDGVAGNNDGPVLHERFGTRRVLDIGGVRIGLTHGHLGPGSTTPERARRTFEDEPGLGAIVRADVMRGVVDAPFAGPPMERAILLFRAA